MASSSLWLMGMSRESLASIRSWKESLDPPRSSCSAVGFSCICLSYVGCEM